MWCISIPIDMYTYIYINYVYTISSSSPNHIKSHTALALFRNNSFLQCCLHPLHNLNLTSNSLAYLLSLCGFKCLNGHFPCDQFEWQPGACITANLSGTQPGVKVAYARWESPEILCSGAARKMTHLEIAPKLICTVSSSRLLFFADRLRDQLTSYLSSNKSHVRMSNRVNIFQHIH